MSDPHDVDGLLAADDSLEGVDTEHLMDLVRGCEARMRDPRLGARRAASLERGQYLRALRERRGEPGVQAFVHLRGAVR